MLKQLRPHLKYQNKNRYKLHSYGQGPFCKFLIPSGHTAPGVYILTIGSRIMYIGECVDLSNRFNYGYGQIAPRACFNGGQLTNCKINRHVLNLNKKGSRICLWFHKTRKHKALEHQLLEKKQPPWNSKKS